MLKQIALLAQKHKITGDLVLIHKLTTVDAFVVFDIEDAPESVGTVRSARKILTSGANDLARSLTYTFASFEMQRGGASAGINATDETRADAIAKFNSEVAPMVSSGRFMAEPGTRVSHTALEPLWDADSRSNIGALAGQARNAGVVAAATVVLGGLEDHRVIIEGFDSVGQKLAKAVLEKGAKVVAVTSQDKGAVDQNGFSADLLNSTDAVRYEAGGGAAAMSTEADLLLVGSKTGVVNHIVAKQLNVKVVVPYAPIPITTRALAVLNRSGTVVVPDFIATAGPLFAWWPSETSGNDTEDAASILANAASKITAVTQEIVSHPEGMFLAACYRAEAFLSTWQTSLPFGRPLAS